MILLHWACWLCSIQQGSCLPSMQQDKQHSYPVSNAMQQDITGINSYTKQFSSGCNITHLKQPALKCTVQQHPSLFLNCCILLHREWLGLRNVWSVVAEPSSALDSSCGVVRMWVRIPAWPVVALVSLSKTLDHNCFILRLGRKALGPVCCVMHVKEPRTLIVIEKGLALVFLDSGNWSSTDYTSFPPVHLHVYMHTVTTPIIFPPVPSDVMPQIIFCGKCTFLCYC